MFTADELHVLGVAVARSSSNDKCRDVCTSGFVYEIVFADTRIQIEKVVLSFPRIYEEQPHCFTLLSCTAAAHWATGAKSKSNLTDLILLIAQPRMSTAA